ncbi:hypothetical protein UQW22_03790 [Isoptericola halotolerans]|uniref:hypothetical protein n=1 Tax=Isoptericola halotolerans TaxID=300560 RepID=UPI00388FD5B8
MDASDTPDRRRPRPTLLGVFTVAGDLLTISLLLLVLSLPLVTAAPAAAAAMEARAAVDPGYPSNPARTLVAGVRSRFRRAWFVAPVALAIGVSSYVAVAFWIAAPAAVGVAMIALVLVIASSAALLTLALPTAMTRSPTFRTAVVEAVRLVAGAPFRSVVALAAAAAAALLAVTYPTFGVVLLGGVLVEIAWRTWGSRPAQR